MNTDVIPTPYEQIQQALAKAATVSSLARESEREQRQKLRHQARIAAACTPMTEEQWRAKIASLLSGDNVDERAFGLYKIMKDDQECWEWVLLHEPEDPLPIMINDDQ